MIMGDGGVVNVSCPLQLHHSILVESLWQLFVCQHGVDLDWNWGGRSIRVHRLVVNAFLPEHIFSEDSILPHKQLLQAPLDGLDHLRKVVEFLYKGSVSVKREELDELMSLASDMQFQLLVDAIGDSLGSKNNDTICDGSCSLKEAPSKAPLEARRRRGRRKQPSPPVAPKMDSTEEEDSGSGGGDEEEWRPTPVKKNLQKSREVAVSKPSKRNNDAAKTEDSYVVGESTTNDQSGKDEPEDMPAERADAKPPIRSVRRRGTSSRSRGGATRGPSAAVAKTHDCPHCTYSTPKNWCYYSHLKTAHGVNTRGEPTESKEYHCDACTFVGKSKCELKYHAVAKHTVDKPFKCSQCPIGFGRKADMVKHIQVAHLGIRPHLCETCGHRTVSKTKLNQHLRVHTGEKPYRCDECGKNYADRTTYRRHMQGHDRDDRPFVCHECGRAFGRQDNLNTHLKKGHRTFSCRLCSYTSGIKGDVGKHLRTVHTDVKPYACDSCSFRTGSAQNLDRHKRSHTGARPFQCTLCPMTYGDRTTYRRHVQRHLSDARPWTCGICGHSFGVRYSLNAHMKHVHKQRVSGTDNPSAPLVPAHVATIDDGAEGQLSVSMIECEPVLFHVDHV